MRLDELAYVVGDDGGMHRHVNDALVNMVHHSKHHKSEDVRKACEQAVASLKNHMQRPLAMYDDPHTFLRIIQSFKGEPNLSQIKHAADALGSYVQTDNE